MISSTAPDHSHLKCVSLATGMKCLPHSRVKTAKGNVLHDSHAEILAIRGFNRWLVDECADLARSGFGKKDGEWVRWRQRGGEDESGKEENGMPPFELQDGVGIHMYCSEAPCGDASMELVMREQADATPWERSIPPSQDEGLNGESEPMLGRGHFDKLGVVRRKPARPDAPITLSKSCSDKLAMKQCTGLLSALTSRLVDAKGTWLSTLVLPESQIVPEAMERCFGQTGRMAPLAAPDVQERWRRIGYPYQSFQVLGTEREFEYSRRRRTSSPTPSNLSIVITPYSREVLINGVLQGRKQEDPRGASCASRRRMWEAVRAVLGEERLSDRTQTYAEMKARQSLEEREVVKRDVRNVALKRWKRNEGDERWALEDAP